MGHDPNLGDRIAVTIIATGFHHKELNVDLPAKNNEPEKIIVKLGDTPSNTTPAPQQPEATVKTSEALAPTLVEMPAAKTPFSFEPKPAFPVQEQQKETFTLQFDEPVAETKNTPEPSKPAEEAPLQLVIKNEEPEQTQQQSQVKIGEHVLSADELEEKRRFEEQKRALEERAERLRKMSFNVKGNEGSDEVENVPAYVRRNVNIDKGVASADTFYSGYSVGTNNNQNNTQAGIQTINTFLDGKKPD